MKRLFLTAIALVMPVAAHAQVTQLLFDSFLAQENIGEYYNGGSGGSGSGPGPNFGVTFGTNALAITSQNAGGAGNFQGNPSGDGIMFWLSGSNTYMNVAGGFDSGFSLFYSAITSAGGNVIVWDGFDGTGNVLATIDLPPFPSELGQPGCAELGQYCPWRAVGAAFAGTGRSISFGGTPNFIGFDNITFGSDDPRVPGTPSVVPEPATFALVGSGLLLLGIAGRRRRRGPMHG